MYVQDYYYDDTGDCDLDECNGKTNEAGLYGYYVTDSYPWVIGCFKGSLDQSFAKAGP